ncbi:MAG: EAL domain-containing protein [Calothrix sp. MO_167.B12]|nr:EAL domain-containing protein [Calothrix sp. MO_167.B12]
MSLNTYCYRQIKLSIATLKWKKSIIATSIIITGLVLGIKQLGWLQYLELVTFDNMVSLQTDAGADPRLLVVEITEADIKKQKRWPISDRTISQALQKLQQAQPRVIGLDMYREIPQLPGRDALLKELQAPNVITIYNLGDVNTEEISPIPGIPPERIGFNDFVIDADGVVRRNFLYGYQGDDKFYSFSLRLSLKYLEKQGISLKVTPDALHLGQTVFLPLEANSGGYQNVDDTGYQVLINYRSDRHIARRVSLSQVLDGQVKPEWVKDKVVLIGTTATSIKDRFFTPYTRDRLTNPGTPGVLIHAQLISQIFSTTLDKQPLFWFWPEWVEGFWIWTWAVIGGYLGWKMRNMFYQIFIATVALGVLTSIYLGFFTQLAWIPLISPALALLLTGATISAYKLQYHRLHDSLTDLPNRELFLYRLQLAIDNTKLLQKSQCALLCLDIDRFKLVNESYGYEMGDLLLLDFASRLKADVESKGIVARVGGDEFAILLENITDSSEANHLADSLQQKLSMPFNNKGKEIFSSASIGIAFHQPELNHKAEELLRDGQTAMYLAKDLGKARHQVFATAMHTEVLKRLRLETDMRRALDKQEFYLNYQPIVSLKTGNIVGFESLVRWQHPEDGFISPGEFIPIAEDTGLIIPLGKWILESACHQLSVWHTQFPFDVPLMMSINLSGQQLTQPNLVAEIEQILQTNRLDGHSIKLEITETVAMQDVETAISILQKLKSLNLQLSIDDFGTGYSSLSYLNRFPINTLKVDRSFVSKMGDTKEDAAIVRTIIMLSHILNLDVVAEGIETVAQQVQLQQLGCEYGQGYLFSKPLDSKKATELLYNQFNEQLSKQKQI